MSSKEYTDEFEKAFEQVFGKDRDLSELSDIDISDFKKVMNRAVVEFRKTAPPEPEEYHDIIYIFWRIYKTIHLLLKSFSSKKALTLISQMNFYELNTNEILIQAACEDELFPIKSNKNLKEITESIIANWKRNRDHLIITGYTKTLFPEYKWIDGFFHNLYPDRLLLRMEYLRKDQYGDLFLEYYWKDYDTPSRPEHDSDYQPVATYYKNDPTAPQPPPDNKDSFQLKYDFQYAEPFKSKQLFDDLIFRSQINKTSEDIGQKAKTAEPIRARLYEVYMRIFHVLLDSVSQGEFDKVLDYCWEQIFSVFSPEEIFSYLEKDRFLNSYRLDDDERSQYLPSFGGVTKLFHLIGYYEKERAVSLQEQNRLRKEFKSLVGKEPWNIDTVSSYAEALKASSQKEALDKILEKFKDMERRECCFWESYYLRLKEYFVNKLSFKNVPDSLKEYMPSISDLSLKNPFLPYLEKIKKVKIDNFQKEQIFPLEEPPLTEAVASQEKGTSIEAKERQELDYKQFPTPKGAVWRDVNILVYDDHIRVVIGETNKIYQQGKIGFIRSKDRSKDIKFENKTMALNRNWIFLNILAEQKQGIDSENVINLGEKMQYNKKSYFFISNHLKKYISDLRIFLKYFLQLQGEPFEILGADKNKFFKSRRNKHFENDYGEDSDESIENDNLEYSTEDTRLIKYKPIFNIFRPTWEQVVVKLVEGSNVELNVCGVYSHKVHLSELGCLNKKGGPSKRGKLLFKLLRSTGELFIREDTHVEDYITLGDCSIIEESIAPQLCKITGIKQRPFLIAGNNSYRILFKTDFRPSFQ